VATFIKVTPNMTGGTLKGYWTKITGTSSVDFTVTKSWSTSTEDTHSRQMDHTFETAESITVESGGELEGGKVAATVSSTQSQSTQTLVSNTITTANEGSAQSAVHFDCPNGQGWVFKIDLVSQLSKGTTPPRLITTQFVCVPAGARNSQDGPQCTQPDNCCSTDSTGDGCQRCHFNPWDKSKSLEYWQAFQDMHPLLKTNPDADLCHDETRACVNLGASNIFDVVCFDTQHVYYHQPGFLPSPIQGITQLDLENCGAHASTSVKDKLGNTVSTNNYCWSPLSGLSTQAGPHDCESYIQNLKFPIPLAEAIAPEYCTAT
jgi:hypothetical protein